MGDIIDFKTALMEKETSSQFKLVAPDGSVWFKYTAEYEFDCDKGNFGLPEYILNNPNCIFPEIKKYEIGFWALNDEDAANRVLQMRLSLKLNGRLLDIINV